MLVLSRKPGEALLVGDNIEITVIETKGDLVRIGIEAPRSVQIWRKEVWAAIVAENKRAAEDARAAAASDIPPLPKIPAPGVKDSSKEFSGLLVKSAKPGVVKPAAVPTDKKG